MYDFIIKRGEVIDPGQAVRGTFDVAIRAGKVAALTSDIDESQAPTVINARGKLVVPGLIDVHGHPAGALIDVGVYPDTVGVQQGVTTVCDGGSLGCANFRAARPYVNELSRTDVFWFLHGAHLGQAVPPEPRSADEIDRDGALRTIDENRDIIRGVKFRAIGRAAQTVGLAGAKAVKQIAVEARLPLMVHLGICGSEVHVPDLAASVEPYTKAVLEILEPGDIITHIYTPKVGGMIKPDGSILPEFRAAIGRGVLLDVGHGGTNFGLEVARIGLQAGIVPHTLSTDVSTVGIARTAQKGLARVRPGQDQAGDVKDPGFSLVALMAKFLGLGFTLEQVVQMTTSTPAKILVEEERRGSLRVGMPADVTVLERCDCEVVFPECTSTLEFVGNTLLVPRTTLKARGNTVEVIAGM